MSSWASTIWAALSGKAGWFQENGEGQEIRIVHKTFQVKKVADMDFVTSPHKIPDGEEDDFTW